MAIPAWPGSPGASRSTAIPPPSGLPFRLPDQEIDVADASIRLDTPAGRIGAALEGRGNLADGFRGRLAAVSRRLDASGCRLESVHAHWSVAIDDLRPVLNGPAFADAPARPARRIWGFGIFDLGFILAA